MAVMVRINIVDREELEVSVWSENGSQITPVVNRCGFNVRIPVRRLISDDNNYRSPASSPAGSGNFSLSVSCRPWTSFCT